MAEKLQFITLNFSYPTSTANPHRFELNVIFLHTQSSCELKINSLENSFHSWKLFCGIVNWAMVSVEVKKMSGRLNGKLKFVVMRE